MDKINYLKIARYCHLMIQGFSHFFRVVSSDDMAVPPLNYPLFLLEIRKIPLESDHFEVLQTLNFGGLNTEIIQSPHFEGG